MPVGLGKTHAYKLRMMHKPGSTNDHIEGLSVSVEGSFIQEKAPLVKKKLDKPDFSKHFFLIFAIGGKFQQPKSPVQIGESAGAIIGSVAW